MKILSLLIMKQIMKLVLLMLVYFNMDMMLAFFDCWYQLIPEAILVHLHLSACALKYTEKIVLFDNCINGPN